MTLEEQIAELIYDNADLSDNLAEIAMKYIYDPETVGNVKVDLGELMNFMVTKVNGLTAAVLLLAKALDERDA